MENSIASDQPSDLPYEDAAPEPHVLPPVESVTEPVKPPTVLIEDDVPIPAVKGVAKLKLNAGSNEKQFSMWPPWVKQKAKELYVIEGRLPDEIALQLNVPVTTLRNWMQKRKNSESWSVLRRRYENERIESQTGTELDTLKGRRIQFINDQLGSSDLLTKHVKKLLVSDDGKEITNPTAKELREVSQAAAMSCKIGATVLGIDGNQKPDAPERSINVAVVINATRQMEKIIEVTATERVS